MSTRLLILTACLLAMACQKRKYPEENKKLDDEGIFFSGSVDNELVSLKIGTEGYYCYSSHRQLADNTYLFQGELRKFDCNPCPRTLRVELADYRQRTPGTAVPPDSVFRNGARGFIPGVAMVNKIRFASRSNKPVASVLWETGNGDTFQDSVLTWEFTQPGQQTIALTIRTTGNCESRVVNKVYVDRETGLFACDISTKSVQGNNAQFKPGVIGGKPPYSYSWNFGDGITSSLEDPAHTYQYAGSYPVKLTITDADGHVSETNYLHVSGNDKSSCAANMVLSFAGSRNALLNGVRLQWTDASNTVLRSDNVTQPSESYFEVIGSQEYGQNENGETGRLLTMRFNVLLSDGSRKVWIKSESTAIAVTYK